MVSVWALLSAVLMGCDKRGPVAPQTESPPTGGSTTSQSLDTQTDTGQTDPCAADPVPGGVQGAMDCDEQRCWVDGGPAWVGSVSGGTDECPPREVTLSGFAIQREEVTRSAYQVCVDHGDCSAVPADCDALFSTWPGDPGRFPATCVSHDDAQSYCQILGGRLPTEAEWEKASRGELGATWPWGDEAPDCERANFRFVTWYCNSGLVEVGSYSPDSASVYGVRDMAGNAWEWVSDWYDAEHYPRAGDEDPQGPTEDCHLAVGAPAETCSTRVIRGGAYNTTEGTVRGAARAFATPETRQENIGFRCAFDK